MAIKNYTTTIDVYKSLGEIQGALASHGARKIMVDYDGGRTAHRNHLWDRYAGGPTWISSPCKCARGQGCLCPSKG